MFVIEGSFVEYSTVNRVVSKKLLPSGNVKN